MRNLSAVCGIETAGHPEAVGRVADTSTAS